MVARTAVDVVPSGAVTAPVAEPVARGRHSRTDDAPPAPAPRRASGRHAAGSLPAPAALPDFTEVELPELDDDVASDEVEALAEQMLGRLAVTEKRPRVLDPHDLPGGKPVFVVGVAVAVTLLLLAVATVLGLIFVR